jgi:AGCS family alanine or glycine:cation symporter
VRIPGPQSHRALFSFRYLLPKILVALVFGAILSANQCWSTTTEPQQSTEFGQLESAEGVASETSVLPEPKGLDQKIDDFFRPIADWTGNIVLVSTPAVGPLPAIPIVLLLLVTGAAYFTVYFRFPNIRLFGLAIRVVRGKYDAIEHQGAQKITKVEVHEIDGDLVNTVRDERQYGEVSHFQALATAVSGTVGLGNIGGVAVAIAIGGPGATFWMIMCGFLGMSSKFVECTLGVKYRDIEPDGTVHGGPMYYLSKGLASAGLAPLGKFLGFLFAVLCVGASFGGGNMFQANQATAQIQTLLGISASDSAWAKSSGTIIGLIMAMLVAFVIIGGIKRIARFTDKIVPFMAALYVAAALIIIIVYIEHVPEAALSILTGAFSLDAGIGGVVGIIIVGFQRAAFSNEAGAGSAAIAHSAVETRYAASEGIVALMEPFLDTIVICTMTALVIILFNSDDKFLYNDVVNKQVLIVETGQRVGGVDLTSMAFDSALPNFRYVLTVAIILFAFSTMISWAYYGLISWKFLFGRSKWSDLSYKMIFCFFIVVGSGASLTAVIDFSDAMILALVFPNMLGLLLLAPRVREELAEFLRAVGQKIS